MRTAYKALWNAVFHMIVPDDSYISQNNEQELGELAYPKSISFMARNPCYCSRFLGAWGLFFPVSLPGSQSRASGGPSILGRIDEADKGGDAGLRDDLISVAYSRGKPRSEGEHRSSCEPLTLGPPLQTGLSGAEAD